jgi:hypothetical protein
VPIAVALAALAAAAPACAHGRNPTVALDYRVTLAPVPQGIRVAILDGDRGLKLSLAGARSATVLGDLREPMLRFGDGGVFVNRSSPTAQANRIVRTPGHGWHRVGSGDSYAWHEHRLAPPPFAHGPYGPVASWAVPVVVDGRPESLGGRFVRVVRPRWWLWLAGVLVAVLAGVALARRYGKVVALVGVAVAASAAVACQTAFVLRDSPNGRLSWVGIVVAAVILAGGAALLGFSRGIARTYAAGGIGAGIAALTLPWIGVFFHGAVIAALPAKAIRFGCAAAIVCGLVALAGSLEVHE